MDVQIRGGVMSVDPDFCPPCKNIRVNKYGYAEAIIHLGGTSKRPVRKYVAIHRLIAGAEPGKVVDHINHNRLDNRRVNLRLCSIAENSAHKKNVKGWTLHRQTGKYQSAITIRGKQKYLGLFDSPEAAAAAYESANRSNRGLFAAKVQP